MRSYRLKKQRGLSLIEIIFSLLILSIGIFAVIGIFPSIFKSLNGSWEQSVAMVIAQEQMDDILTKNVAIDTAATTIYLDESGAELSGTPPTCLRSGYITYRGEADPGGNTNIQIIIVEVTWVEQGYLLKTGSEWKEHGMIAHYRLTSAICP